MNYSYRTQRPAHGVDAPNLAPYHAHGRGVFAESSKIDIERSVAVELPERADAVTRSTGENAEFRSRRNLLAAFSVPSALRIGRAGA